MVRPMNSQNSASDNVDHSKKKGSEDEDRGACDGGHDEEVDHVRSN